MCKNDHKCQIKGLYMSPEPIVIRKSSEKVAVLLMEANFHLDEKSVSRDDLMLFALTCVLSSTVIYGIGTELSESMLELLQLYVKCGIGPDLERSSLDFVLLFDDWKLLYHYPYGYHDSGTCPPIGNKMYNFRNDRLRLDGNQSEFALRNQFFVDTFQKISFCLMPDPIFTDQNANEIRQKPSQTFSDVLRRGSARLFLPSNLAVKKIVNRKLNGHHMRVLFEHLSGLHSESDIKDNKDYKESVNNVTALSNGINFYKFQMNKLIDDRR